MVGSLAELAADGPGMVARQQRLAAPLLGQGRRIVEGSYAGAYGHGLSNGAGLFGRLTLGDISLIGGGAYGEDEGGRAELSGAVTFAAALRYLVPGRGPFRPYAELGGWLTSGADLRISRTYMNGAGTATGVGETQGDISYYYVRLGAAVALGGSGELAVAGEVGRSRLEIDGYVEPLSSANPFEATVDRRFEEMTLLRLRGQYNATFGGRFHASLYGAAVWSRSEDRIVTATIPGFGMLGAVSSDDRSWFEFGARLGYDITPRLTIEVFADGDTGEDRVGEGAHAGIALRFRM